MAAREQVARNSKDKAEREGPPVVVDVVVPVKLTKATFEKYEIEGYRQPQPGEWIVGPHGRAIQAKRAWMFEFVLRERQKEEEGPPQTCSYNPRATR